jgi:hypothetical protein
MNIFSIIYIFTTIIIFVLIFLFFKSSKDKYNLFKIYDNNDNNSVYDINNHGHENDKALQNWKYRRLQKKYSNYDNNNSDNNSDNK